MKQSLNERLKRMLAEINPKAYEMIYVTTQHVTPQRATLQHNATSPLTERLARLEVKPKPKPKQGQRQV